MNEKSRAKMVREVDSAVRTGQRRVPSAQPAAAFDPLSLLLPRKGSKKPTVTSNQSRSGSIIVKEIYKSERVERREEPIDSTKNSRLGARLKTLNHNLATFQAMLAEKASANVRETSSRQGANLPGKASSSKSLVDSCKTQKATATKKPAINQPKSISLEKLLGLPKTFSKTPTRAKGAELTKELLSRAMANESVKSQAEIERSVSPLGAHVECKELLQIRIKRNLKAIKVATQSLLKKKHTNENIVENSSHSNIYSEKTSKPLQVSKARAGEIRRAEQAVLNRSGEERAADSLLQAAREKRRLQEARKKTFVPLKSHDAFANTFCPDIVANLIALEREYHPGPHFLERNQRNLKWEMRAILVDWIQEVSSNYFFKREIFHYAVNYIDRFLAVRRDIETNQLQLVGVTALFLAAKMDEVYTPKLESMVAVTNNTYSAHEIRECERTMYAVLEMKICPPTMNMWAQFFTTEWDRYLKASTLSLYKTLFDSKNLPRFKSPNEKSYSLFRELMQLIDVCLLDTQTLQYNFRAIVAAFMYIIIGKRLDQFTIEQVREEFPYSSLYLLDQSYTYNQCFGEFIEKILGLLLQDLLPTIQFVSTFFFLQTDVEFPLAARVDTKEVLEGHFEEFLSYQTHNAECLPFVLNARNRKMV